MVRGVKRASWWLSKGGRSLTNAPCPCSFPFLFMILTYHSFVCFVSEIQLWMYLQVELYCSLLVGSITVSCSTWKIRSSQRLARNCWSSICLVLRLDIIENLLVSNFVIGIRDKWFHTVTLYCQLAMGSIVSVSESAAYTQVPWSVFSLGVDRYTSFIVY